MLGRLSESGSGLNELSPDGIHADTIAVGRAAESYGLSGLSARLSAAHLLAYFRNWLKY